MNIEELVRPELLLLQKYTVYNGNQESVKLHKNENPWSPLQVLGEVKLNRYPDPEPSKLISLVARHYKVDDQEIFLSRGSDEAIDLLIRLFCRSGQDAILISPPTFGIYAHYAAINNVSVQRVYLSPSTFDLDVNQILATIKDTVKIIFLCTPNNPTGNTISIENIKNICEQSERIVVVDEAYMDFSEGASSIEMINQYKNLVVLRTVSKGFGMAGIRCGITFSSVPIINFLKKIAAPYTLSSLSIYAAEKLFSTLIQNRITQHIEIIKGERKKLMAALKNKKNMIRVWQSSGNFILIQIKNAPLVYQKCIKENILVRDLSGSVDLKNCLRITIGSPSENVRLLKLLSTLEESLDA